MDYSQPTLSRQIRDMEAELGKQLFIRGSRSITLTEEGMILRKRAEEIMELVKKAEDGIALAEELVAGDITVGAGETDGLRVLVRAVQALREEWPEVHLHVVSGDKCSVIEQLDGGRTLEDLQVALRYVDSTPEERDYSVIGEFTPKSAEGICVYCNHCQPCPKGLNVGLINKYYDLALAGDELAKGHYEKLSLHAGDCVKCGHCESRWCRPWGLGNAVGLNAVISKALGERRPEKVRKAADAAIFIELCSWGLIVVMCLALVGPYFNWQSGGNEGIAKYGRDYLTVCMLFSFGQMGQWVFDRFVIASGRSSLFLFTLSAAPVTNLIRPYLYLWLFRPAPDGNHGRGYRHGDWPVRGNAGGDWAHTVRVGGHA